MSAKHITVIIVDSVPIEKRGELVLKRPCSMMLLLPADIEHDLVDPGHSDAERSVPFLPSEIFHRGEGVVEPLRRTTLEQLGCFGDRDRRGQGQKYVNVVIGATNGQRLHFVLTRNTAEVRPKTLANVRRDHLPPSTRAEDEMDHTIRIGVRHRLTIFAANLPDSAVPTGLSSRGHGDPPPSVETLGYFQTPLRGTAVPKRCARSA